MLQLVLKANAASCGLFGVIFLFWGAAVAEFVGDPPPLLLQLLGAGLLVNATALIWASLQAKPDRVFVLAFALGDLAWVVATLALLLGGFWISTPSGMAWAICVAVFVGTCGALQWKLAPKPQ